MIQKKSSFQMGNQFNGYGDTVYLKADTVKVPIISQDNVQLTPNYSCYALYAIGGNPVMLNPNAVSNVMKMIIGSSPAMNQVSLVKNESNGSYVTSFSVSSQGFIDNSYPTFQNSPKKATMGTKNYFSITKESSLTVRSTYSSSGDRLGEIAPGGSFKVVTEDGRISDHEDADNASKPRWTKISYNGGNGWVTSEFIREDIIVKKDLSAYGLNQEINITVNLKDNSVEKRKKTPSKNWFMVPTGSYPSTCQKVNGKWCVAVGPAVFDPEYSKTGQCRASDMIPFSKMIKVKLKHKTKGNERIEEFCVCDIKAHSFNKYPYDNADKDAKLLSDKGEGFFESDGVDNVKINPSIKHGVIQTGIRYTNADNVAVVALIKDKTGKITKDNIDFSIIEFCGKSMSDSTIFADYELISIETNYEKTTRGKLYDYNTGKEKVLKK